MQADKVSPQPLASMPAFNNNSVTKMHRPCLVGERDVDGDDIAAANKSLQVRLKLNAAQLLHGRLLMPAVVDKLAPKALHSTIISCLHVSTTTSASHILKAGLLPITAEELAPRALHRCHIRSQGFASP